MKILGNYHDFYLNTDVLFIGTCLEYYTLDHHCFSSLGLNWDAMLKINTGMYLFVEKV